MRGLFLVLIALFIASCDEPQSFDNRFNFEISGQHYYWQSNDGQCQILNAGLTMSCTFDNGVQEANDDVHITLNLDEEITERTYQDNRTEAYPEINFDFWIPADDGVRHLSTNMTIDEPQILTISTIALDKISGEFEGYVEDDDSENAESVTGRFELVNAD